jgi:dolichyl-phosphate beta-glucosyltransferase
MTQVPWMSVVIPAYNEEAAIGGTVTAVRAWLEERGRPYEILVIDNASEDGTVEVLEPLADGERLRVLRNDANRGKGYSVRRGMLEASGRLRLLCDADCGPSLASLDRMVALIEDADVVVGSRTAEGAEITRGQPLRRKLVGWPFITLTRILLLEPTYDIYCGFKLWRGSAADEVFRRQHLDGWTFDAEVLALARRMGYRIEEAGIAWHDRDGSRLSIGRVLVPVVRELLAARRHVRRETRGVQPLPVVREPLLDPTQDLT